MKESTRMRLQFIVAKAQLLLIDNKDSQRMMADLEEIRKEAERSYYEVSDDGGYGSR